jgi:hypothetical protein
MVMESRIPLNLQRSVLVYSDLSVGHIGLLDGVPSFDLSHRTKQGYGFGVEEGRGESYSIHVTYLLTWAPKKEAAR